MSFSKVGAGPANAVEEASSPEQTQKKPQINTDEHEFIAKRSECNRRPRVNQQKSFPSYSCLFVSIRGSSGVAQDLIHHSARLVVSDMFFHSVVKISQFCMVETEQM